MFRNRLTRRLAAAVVAASLSIGGVAAAEAVSPDDAPVEDAGATWSFYGGWGSKGGPSAGTNGATWS